MVDPAPGEAGVSDEAKAVWNGYLERGEQSGTVKGELTDEWGWTVFITGTLRPEGGYRLTGTLGPVPPSLTCPIIDDPPDKLNG